MFERTRLAFKGFDWLMLGSVVLLTGLGLLAIYSLGLGNGNFLNFKKQITFATVGVFAVLLVGTLWHYRWISYLSSSIYYVMLGLLVFVLFFGETIRGTTGWLFVGPLGFQPVELAKVVLLIIMAKFLAKHGRHTKDLRVVVQSAVTVMIMVLLVMLQPDLGGAVILATVWFAMVAVSGMRWMHVLTMGAVAILMAGIAWMFVFQPYQKERVMTFLDPASDPFGQGYNVTQSVIAIGAGQLGGRGVASGSQSQLRFLPEAQTDFIFSVIAEELGFVGVVVLLGLFGLLMSRLYLLARKCRDDFTQFLVVGTAALIGIEVFVNIGVATGILPVTGITLPFVSYGGSSLIVHFILIAIMENISVRRG